METETTQQTDQTLSVRDDDASKDIIFSTASGEIIKLCGDGRIYVKGREVADDIELVDGLREWLVGAQHETPKHIVSKMQEMQQINMSSTDMNDEYYRGMHNGMEVLISVLGKREPNFLKARELGSDGQHHI